MAGTSVVRRVRRFVIRERGGRTVFLAFRTFRFEALLSIQEEVSRGLPPQKRPTYWSCMLGRTKVGFFKLEILGLSLEPRLTI